MRADFADAIDELAAAGESDATSPTWTSASPRRRSTRSSAASPTPRMPRSTCAWTRTRNSPPARSSTTGPTDRLAGILRSYGEERHARSIAAEIVRRRPIETTFELVEAVRDAVPPSYRFGRGHPAKKTFQAIRIAVNGELDSLDRALPGAWALLARAVASARSRSTRSRTGGSSASSPSAPASASARRSSRVRLLAPARGGAHHPPCRGRLARGGRAQPPLALCPPARRAQAPRSA